MGHINRLEMQSQEFSCWLKECLAGDDGNSVFHNAYAFADFCDPTTRWQLPSCARLGPFDFAQGRLAGRPSLHKTVLAICPCYQQDSYTVEDKHQAQVHLGFARSAFKFLPGKNSPQSGDHRSGLPYGIRDRYSGEAGPTPGSSKRPRKLISTSPPSAPEGRSLPGLVSVRIARVGGPAPREPALSEVEGSKPSKARQLSATIHCHEETNNVEHNV